MVRRWASGTKTPLEVMAERESIYQLLSQTAPESMPKNHSSYTIDPATRYYEGVVMGMVICGGKLCFY